MKNTNRFFKNKETEEIYSFLDLENFYNKNKSDFPEFKTFENYLNYYLEYDLMEEIFPSSKQQYANITDNIFLSVSSLLNYKADLYIQEAENLVFYKSIDINPCISFKEFEKLIKEAV